MALTLKESLAKAAAEKAAAEVAATMTYDVAPMTLEAAPAVMDMVDMPIMAAYSGDDGSWTQHTGYKSYSDYYDDNLSIIDENKSIALNDKQFNITQEENSQLIPFEMPRYYDGFDLTKTAITIHYETVDGYHGEAIPVNVTYNNSKIRFAWLVDAAVTHIAGTVRFEVRATGSNSKGQAYVWKSRTFNELNVLQSLCVECDKKIVLDDSWVQEVVEIVTRAITNSSIDEEVQSAKDAANRAQNSATQAAQIANETEARLEAAVQSEMNRQINTTLTNYYTRTETGNLIAVQISTALASHYTAAQVDAIVKGLDGEIDGLQNQINNLDGLAKFNVEYDGATMTFYNGESVMKAININSDPSVKWTTTYTAIVEQKIADAIKVPQDELAAYKEVTDADLQGIHEAIDDLPETLANDYYNKAAADEKFATKSSLAEVKTTADTAASNASAAAKDVSTLSTTVQTLQSEVNAIDKSPRLTYNMIYNEDGTYKLVLQEITNEGQEDEVRTEKAVYVIQGGGGGTGTSSSLKIEYVTKTPLVVTVKDKALITYNFSGTDSSGDAVLDGTATWKIGNTVIASETISAGENTFDATQYLSIGTQKLILSITDAAGSLVTKQWNVQKIDVRIESTFNDKLTYPMGAVSFDYTPYGAISKDVHFILDGKEIGTTTTTASGIPMAYNLPTQIHGSHLLDVYMTATVNNNDIESDHITKDILWYDPNSTVPVIGCVMQNFTAKQYDTTNIVYTVYDPTTESPKVTLAVDGVVVSNLTLESNTQTWQYKSIDVGTHTLTITCGETVKTLKATVEKLDIEIEPVTAGLAFDFDPMGKSNSDEDRLWTDGAVSMSVSDNFDWVNGGYQLDENGDQYFCIKAGTSAVIDYQLFGDDAKVNGKEFKLVFKTTNIQSPDAKFLSCVDNTIGTDYIGIEMFAQEAYIYGQADKLHLPYSEEDIIEFEFNINKNTETIPMVMGYEDGVSTCPMIYDSSYSFKQVNPKYITLGSDKCDLHIYRLKAYKTSLNARGILNNFIADARNADEMIDRYNRNQIYDENQNLTPETLAEKCPWLHVIKLSAPKFTNDKDEKIIGTRIEHIFKNGDPILDNWVCVDAAHSGQGTSSNAYGQAGRNLDFILKTYKDYGNKPVITLGDGVTTVSKVSLTRNSIPVNYFNMKVNVASSEHANNSQLAERYNTYNPVERYFVREEGYDTSKIRDTMEFVNAVVFVQETDPVIANHREFADCDWHR